MTPEQYIEDKAKEKYPDFAHFYKLTGQAAYAAGAEMMLEHMGKFLEWADRFYGRKYELNIPGPWYSLDDLLSEEPLTTSELIEEYFSTL